MSERIFWYYRTKNQSPRVTAAFLAAQKKLLLPGQYRREHENSWEDGQDSFTTAADVDYAMSRSGPEPVQGAPDVPGYAYFTDIGLIHDPTVIGVGHLDLANHVIVDRLITFQGSREEPVVLGLVEAALQQLARTFPPVQIKVESWQGAQVAERLRATLPMEIYTPTAKKNAEEWPLLAARLSQRTIVLPQHAQLREELLNLTYEVGRLGVKVTDRGKVHQDHAVAVRGLAAALEPWAIGYDPHRYDLTEEEKAQLQAFSRWFDADPPVVPLDHEGEDDRDMRWFRHDYQTGQKRYLW